MQKKLFYEDPYCKEFESTVLKCGQGKGGYEIVLAESAFYPEGGGQPADKGWLGEVEVLDVHEKEGEVVHICTAPLPIGSRVCGRLDFDRRFRHMQQHTGEHIFSGLIYQNFGYHNVGFHMGKDFITVDFDGLLTQEQIQQIEKAANEVVFADREVAAFYPSREELAVLSYRSKKELQGAIRIVEVPGADVCACCGTHVQRTGEIGTIKVTGNEKYKGGSRIFLQIGWMALEDYQTKANSVLRISNLLSAKPEAVGEAVEKLQKLAGDQKFQLIQLKKELLQYKAAALQAQTGRLCVEAADMEAAELRQLCDLLLSKCELVLTFAGEDAAGYKFVLGKKDGGVLEAGKAFMDACSARGGGKGNMLQGSAACTREQLITFALREWQMETARL